MSQNEKTSESSHTSPSDKSDLLTYPAVGANVAGHLVLGVAVVTLAMLIQVAVTLLTVDVSEGSDPAGAAIMFSAVPDQVSNWSSYVLGDGLWWFGAAVAAIAFLLPAALQAPTAQSHLSGKSLRKYFANLASVIGATSVATMVFAYLGANLATPDAAPKLFLATAATLVIVLAAGLISSHEGYDASASFEQALDYTSRTLKLRVVALRSTVDEPSKGTIWLAILYVMVAGVVQIIVIPALFVILTQTWPAGFTIDEMQGSFLVAIWVVGTLLCTFTVGVLTSAFQTRWGPWVFVSLVVGVMGLFLGLLATIAFPVSGMTWQWLIALGSAAIFIAAVITSANWLRRNSPKRASWLRWLARYSFPGSVLALLTLFTLRRKFKLDEEAAQIAQRAREASTERAASTLELPESSTRETNLSGG